MTIRIRSTHNMDAVVITVVAHSPRYVHLFDYKWRNSGTDLSIWCGLWVRHHWVPLLSWWCEPEGIHVSPWTTMKSRAYHIDTISHGRVSVIIHLPTVDGWVSVLWETKSIIMLSASVQFHRGVRRRRAWTWGTGMQRRCPNTPKADLKCIANILRLQAIPWFCSRFC